MKPDLSSPGTNFWRLLALAMLVNVIAQAIHETGHLLVYQAYGRNPTWGFIGLVQLWEAEPLDPSGWTTINGPGGVTGWLRVDSLPTGTAEKTLAASAGPVASLVSVALGLWLAGGNRTAALRQVGLALALLVSFVMLLYYLRSPWRGLSDESEIAGQLGIARVLVEVPLGLAFATGLFVGLRRLDTWRVRGQWLAAILLGSIPTGFLLLYADGWVREMVNRGHPFFEPIMGYSAPVLLVYLAAFAGVVVWGSGHNGRAAPGRMTA